MLAATALVLLMTPALGLFYAGLVRVQEHAQHVHDVRRARSRVATVTWAVVGYSLAFERGQRLHRRPRPRVPATASASSRAPGRTIPHLLFFAFQATFCIVTAALVSGAVVERMRFGAFLLFAALWSVLVYAVLAHWAFGGGWLQANGTLDFAGGVPVEMGSGFSALAAALVVGARKDYGRQALLPHNAVYVLVGAGLLWFGWFGFNGGSGFSTGHAGVLAFTNTLLTPAVTLVVWFVLDLVRGAAGDGDRRRHGDHRRLRGDHAGGRLHQPGLGDGARRARRAAELRGDRLAPAHAGRRDARRARRPRRRRPHRHPVHRLRSRSWRGTASPTASLYGDAGPARLAGAGRARRARLRVRR